MPGWPRQPVRAAAGPQPGNPTSPISARPLAAVMRPSTRVGSLSTPVASRKLLDEAAASRTLCKQLAGFEGGLELELAALADASVCARRIKLRLNGALPPVGHKKNVCARDCKDAFNRIVDRATEELPAVPNVCQPDVCIALNLTEALDKHVEFDAEWVWHGCSSSSLARSAGSLLDCPILTSPGIAGFVKM
jgi:hypothetical protein